MEPCPHCGQPLAIVPAQPTYQGWRQPITFNSTAPTITAPLDAPAPAYSKYERRQPARPATWESDVLVPLAQSAMWGVIGGLLSIGLPAFAHWPWWTPFPAFVLSTSVAWWIISSDHHRALWIVEKMTGRDIDGDGHTGAPKPESAPPVISLEMTARTEAGTFVKMFRFDLDKSITEALFQQWGREALKNADLTQARWVKRNKFTREAYTDLLDKLEQADLVQRVGSAKNAPYELTREGKQTISRYLWHTHSHSLTHTYDEDEAESEAGQG
jgi:hypothetical protein